MKKSLLALAVLGAFASAASAQSSVTLYGRVDLSIGKNQGSDAKVMQNGSGSRLGVRGVEDLGGGMQAFFNVEHRFNADTGAQSNAQRFWTGRSLVGLQGGFGKVSLGREYSTAFLGSQLVADPWGWDTVAAANTVAITGLGGIAKVRYDSSITYNFAASGLSFGIQTAERNDQGGFTNVPKRPLNFAVGYAGGPLTVGFGYEKTGASAAEDEKMWTVNAAYSFGAFKLGGFYGKGNTAAGADHKGLMLTATATMGQGEFRAMVGRLKANSTTVNQSWALGYHYALSKRTTLYGDLTANSKLATSKNGYDVGIKHNF